MIIVDDLRALSKPQRSAFLASFLGWTLDAFDFFILTFIVADIAKEFSTPGHKVEVSAVSLGIALTLMMRPLGAFIFGWLADRFGRRPVLMVDVLLFAGLEFASAFAPTLPILLGLRLLFGIAMGGEWGIGASLALESIPAKSRGIVSGVLQTGYPFGFLLAAVVNIFAPQLGWRGMFMVGVAPAFLVLYIRQNVHESPAFEAVRDKARARKANRAAPPALVSAERPPVALLQTLVLLAAAMAIPVWIASRTSLTSFAFVAATGAGLVLALALLAVAYVALRRGGAVASHAGYALRTFWLAFAGMVLFGLILFSVQKPFRQLGIDLGLVIEIGAAILALWFLARGVYGVVRASAGHGFRPIEPESFAGSLGSRWPLLLYVVVLMTGFNFFSHGSQDLYPTFLKLQHHFSPGLVSTLTIVGNLGAIVGGFSFGALSERIGRRRAIVIACLLALPMIPLWAFSTTPVLLGLGAFLMQIAVQGAWGVVPVHLNELSPDAARGTFPGLAYQLGNLIASGNAVIQAGIAEQRHDDYGLALAVVIGIVALVLAALSFFGPEKKGVQFGGGASETRAVNPSRLPGVEVQDQEARP